MPKRRGLDDLFIFAKLSGCDFSSIANLWCLQVTSLLKFATGPEGITPPQSGTGIHAALNGKTRDHWFTCTTFAGGKPLKNVLLAAE